MEIITLNSSQVYLAEDNTNPDSYIAKFIICDFGRNKNGVALDRDGIEEWIDTLKNKPLVGKIKMKYDGTYDFSGHNVKKVTKTDQNGNTYQEIEFDTEAFGTFFEVGIETINDAEFIVASCEIWKRFTKACEIIIARIQDGTLYTSWEVAIEQSKQGIIEGLMTKIITLGRFLGHCLLAKNVSPAYDSSGLMEIASTEYDIEFAEALSQDMISQGLDKTNNQEKEDCILKNDEKITVSSETDTVGVHTDIDVSNEGNENLLNSADSQSTEKPDETSEKKQDDNNDEEEGECKKKKVKSTNSSTEISALTEYDLRERIRKACKDKLNKWCWIAFHFPVEKEVWLEIDDRESQLDFVRMTYVVDNDIVNVSEPEDVKLTVSVKDVNTTIAEYEKTIAEKDELIIKTSSEITSLKSENTELSQYKEKFTEMEQEKVAAELNEQKETLISSVIKSGQITREEIESSEEFSGYVNNLDKKSLMSVVGERLTSSLEKKTSKNTDVQEKNDMHVASNLNNEDELTDKASIMRSFLKRN